MEETNCCLNQKVSCKFALCDIQMQNTLCPSLFMHLTSRLNMHYLLNHRVKSCQGQVLKGKKTITVFPFQILISVFLCSSLLRLKTVSIRPMSQKLSGLEAEKNVETNNDMAFSALFAVNRNNKRFFQ